jgi:hypothetical protein
MKRRLAFTFLALTACAAPVSNDVALEIMDASSGNSGEKVALKTSASLKSGSLSDASELWLGFGWQKVNSGICKDVAPSDWRDVRAFDYTFFVSETKSNLFYAYNLRICATQLSNPKRIAAIGFVESSQKMEPLKP